MVEGKGEKSSKFINVIDNELRQSIIRLDQKLNGLQAELKVKIESIGDTSDHYEQERERVFTLLEKELDKAIHSIKDLINMVVSDEITEKEFLQINHENIEMLRETFAAKLDMISKLKEQF